MATASDICTGALLNINSYAPGETLNATDGTTVLNALNDLTDSLNNDEAYVYTQIETIFNWVNGQFQYSVGNPVSSNTFTGTATGSSNIISSIPSIPSDLIKGGTITDVGGVVPSGTTITAVGANTVTLSQNVTSTYPNNPDTFSYTVPGNIPMNRPLRMRQGFTRANTSGQASLDYTFQFTDFDNYKRQLLKNVQGPWPYIAAYQPTFPYGTLYVYPAPASGWTAHIFSDLIIPEWPSVTTTFSLPQGYRRSLIKLLALEICPIYGKTPSPELRKQAKDAMDLIKGTNAVPVPVMQFDTAISRSQTNDASWIQDGGFR